MQLTSSSPTVSAVVRSLVNDYRARYGFELLVTDPNGVRIEAPEKHAESETVSLLRRQAIQEALRWGEPSLLTDAEGRALWAVPIMDNEHVTGGLVVEGVVLVPDESGEGGEDAGQWTRHIREACLGLLEAAIHYNVTNASRLELARQAAEQERFRAEAIHEVKSVFLDSVREVYLREEPALLAAIKRGERPAAREIINRVLVRIYHLSGQRLDLLKSFVLELVVMMCRAAVESGADPTEVLGLNFRSIRDLSEIRDDEHLCAWLTGMLERVMDAIRDHKTFPNTVLVARALDFMEKHLDEPLERDAVARGTGLSGSHFSHLMREKTGRTFTDLLAQMRINRARALLARTDKSIVQVAMECGFCDQSYFTRVFRKYTGESPGEYRQRSGR